MSPGVARTALRVLVHSKANKLMRIDSLDIVFVDRTKPWEALQFSVIDVHSYECARWCARDAVIALLSWLYDPLWRVHLESLDLQPQLIIAVLLIRKFERESINGSLDGYTCPLVNTYSCPASARMAQTHHQFSPSSVHDDLPQRMSFQILACPLTRSMETFMTL